MFYSYTPKNELELADVTELGVNTVSSYFYDVDGIRSRKVVDGETVDFLTDANRAYAQVVKETNATTGDITDYLYGDDLIKQSKAANDSYYLYDGLGSTRALTDATGSIINTYDYESFGSVLNQTGTTENNYLFTGEQYDAGLDNYYLRARYYDQNVGRFTQMDTWMGRNNDPVTLHKYLYANVDPVNNVDPTGNFTMVQAIQAVNIAGTLATIAQSSVKVFSLATGESEFSATELGTEILLSRLGGPAAQKMIGLIGKKGQELLKSGFDTVGCFFNSFPAGTLVLTDSGLVAIENISIGDMVMAYDDKTGETGYKEVTHLISNTQDYNFVVLEIDNGEIIEATPEHPFFVDKEWVDASEVSANDVLFGYSGEVNIGRVSRDIRDSTVYNLTVAGYHTYFVGHNNALVHNKNATKGCKFRGRKAKGFDWDHIFDRHSSTGNVASQRTRLDGNSIFPSNLSRRQIQARVKGGWKNRELMKSRVDKKTGETILHYDGFDPVSGTTVSFRFNPKTQRVITAFPK